MIEKGVSSILLVVVLYYYKGIGQGKTGLVRVYACTEEMNKEVDQSPKEKVKLFLHLLKDKYRNSSF